jgi:quercetin dioxygenase-like cupin family protein
MRITRNDAQPSVMGDASSFSGPVRIDHAFRAEPPGRVQGAVVTFEPGARSAWHSHPLGQTLVVLSGSGRVQAWGGPIEELSPGDVVWAPPAEKHWHGASPTVAMAHLAVQEATAGTAVDWMEKVTDEQYASVPPSARPTRDRDPR